MTDSVKAEVLDQQARLTEHYGFPVPVSVVLEIRLEIDRWLSFVWTDRTKSMDAAVFNSTVDQICDRFVQAHITAQAQNKIKAEAKRKKSSPLSAAYRDYPLPIIVEEYDWAVSRQKARRYRIEIEKMLGPVRRAASK